MPVSKLLWGAGLENEVRIGYPLFDILTDREEEEGSQHVITPGGTPISWIPGRYYTMDAEVRWIPDGPTTSPVQTALSGAVGWQEFIDWARDAGVFRFVPDETVPDFYVDNVQLMEPRKGFGSLSTDIKRNVRLKLRNPTMDFHQALRGIMFEYAPGMSLTDPVAATFTRATAATRRGLPGNLAAAIGASDAAGVLRDRHYEGALKTTLLEAARTQLVTDPENFGAWDQVGTPVLTAGQADPFGGTAAYLVNDDDGAAQEYIRRTVTYTGNATKAQLGFVRAGTAAQTEFALVADGFGQRVRITVTWTAGVASAAVGGGSGTARAIAWGGGWYLIEWTADGVLAAEVNRYTLFPAGSTATNTGTVYFFGANAWNAPFPSSYQGPSLGTRNADVLSWPFTHRPQGTFFYVKFVERGGNRHSTDTRVWAIEPASSSAPRICVYTTGVANPYHFFYEGPGAGIERSPAAVPAIGDTVELLGLLYPDGSVQVLQAVNAGAPESSARSSATSIPDAWAQQNFSLGSNMGSAPGFDAFARMKVGPLTFGGITRDTIAKALVA